MTRLGSLVGGCYFCSTMVSLQSIMIEIATWSSWYQWWFISFSFLAALVSSETPSFPWLAFSVPFFFFHGGPISRDPKNTITQNTSKITKTLPNIQNMSLVLGRPNLSLLTTPLSLEGIWAIESKKKSCFITRRWLTRKSATKLFSQKVWAITLWSFSINMLICLTLIVDHPRALNLLLSVWFNISSASAMLIT